MAFTGRLPEKEKGILQKNPAKIISRTMKIGFFIMNQADNLSLIENRKYCINMTWRKNLCLKMK